MNVDLTTLFAVLGSIGAGIAGILAFLDKRSDTVKKEASGHYEKMYSEDIKDLKEHVRLLEVRVTQLEDSSRAASVLVTEALSETTDVAIKPKLIAALGHLH